MGSARYQQRTEPVENGSVMLEFSICMSLIFMLVLGLVSVYFAVREHDVVIEAMRTGGRAAGMLNPGATPDRVTQTVLAATRRYMNDSGYPSNGYAFKITPRTIELSSTAAFQIVRLEIRRSESAVYDILTGMTFSAPSAAEFPIANGNTALPFDSEE